MLPYIKIHTYLFVYVQFVFSFYHKIFCSFILFSFAFSVLTIFYFKLFSFFRLFFFSFYVYLCISSTSIFALNLAMNNVQNKYSYNLIDF